MSIRCIVYFCPCTGAAGICIFVLYCIVRAPSATFTGIMNFSFRAPLLPAFSSSFLIFWTDCPCADAAKRVFFQYSDMTLRALVRRYE
jgi:hypothetical protein